MSNAKEVVDALVQAMWGRPTSFSCTEYRLTDMDSGLVYWIGSGFMFAGIYKPYEMKFGWIQGWRFHRMLRKWKSINAIQKTSTNRPESERDYPYKFWANLPVSTGPVDINPADNRTYFSSERTSKAGSPTKPHNTASGTV